MSKGKGREEGNDPSKEQKKKLEKKLSKFEDEDHIADEVEK